MSRRAAPFRGDTSTRIEAPGAATAYHAAMSAVPNVSATATLIGDPARTLMLTALLAGRALPAGELAYAAGVSAQTASSHLAKLLSGGLLVVETEGRHRYYRLAGAHVAQAMEQLAAIRPPDTVRRKALSPEARRLRFARCCYNHLAGRLGVALTQALEVSSYIVPAADKRYDVTPSGARWLGALGLSLAALEPASRGLARQCLDWTEREHHLGGPLGVALTRVLCEQGWLRRAGGREVKVTAQGRQELLRRLGIDVEALRTQA
jgi:DNA-binding transcriptional ArsR family regulator